MRAKNTVSIILIVVGIVILVLSLLADPIGIGRDPGFGYKQTVGSVVGAIVTIVGLVWKFKK